MWRKPVSRPDTASFQNTIIFFRPQTKPFHALNANWFSNKCGSFRSQSTLQVFKTKPALSLIFFYNQTHFFLKLKPVSLFQGRFLRSRENQSNRDWWCILNVYIWGENFSSHLRTYSLMLRSPWISVHMCTQQASMHVKDFRIRSALKLDWYDFPTIDLLCYLRADLLIMVYALVQICKTNVTKNMSRREKKTIFSGLLTKHEANIAGYCPSSFFNGPRRSRCQ